MKQASGVSQKRIVLIGVAMLACVMVGVGMDRFVQAVMAPAEAEPAEEAAVAERPAPVVRTVIVTNSADLAAMAALRKRVAELEQSLAARDGAPAQVAEKPKEEAPREDRNSRRQSWQERMEKMRTENPEQYAAEQKRREEFRQSIEQRAQDRASYLESVDTKGMTAEQRENHEKLLATVAQVNALMAQMMQNGGNRDQNNEARQQMGEAMASLGGLYDAERDYLLCQTARQVGYQKAEEVRDFAETLKNIFDNTTMPHMGRGGSFRGPLPSGGAAAGGAPAAQ